MTLTDEELRLWISPASSHGVHINSIALNRIAQSALDARAELSQVKADAAAAVSLLVERAAEGLVNAFLHMQATYAKEISALTPFDPLQAFYEKEVVWSAIGDAQVAIRALSSVDGLALVAELRADVQGWASNATEAWRLMREAEAERNTLAAEVAAIKAQEAILRKAVDFLRTTIRKNIVVKDGPHTVQLPDGSIHSGPVAEFLHELLPNIAEVLDRAALAQAQPAAEEGEK